MIARLSRDERGGALLIAMVAAVFLTLLGTILMSVVRQGFVQAASSEANVQAETLAQKGLDEARALIQLAVKEANGTPGTYTYSQKVGRIQSALGLDTDPTAAVVRAAGSLHDFIHDSDIQGLRGTYKLEIISDIDNYESFTAHIGTIPDYPYARTIRIKSTGLVDSRPVRKVEKESTIVISTINPVFKYPVSATNDITLNGASAIVGDILAKNGEIATQDQAYFVGLPGTKYGKDTDLPSVKGFYKASSSPGLVLLDPLTGAPVPTATTWFSKAQPLEDIWMPLDQSMDIAGKYITPKIAEMMGKIAPAAGSPPFDAVVTSGGVMGTTIASNTFSQLFIDQWVDFSGHVEISGGVYDDFAVKGGSLTMQPGADVRLVGGSLYIDNDSAMWAAADLTGKLVLDPGQSVVIRGDAVISADAATGDPFYLRGNIVVDGNLKIIGSVNIDGALYVNGNVELKELKEINQDSSWAGKPLILVANGVIDFSDSRPPVDPANPNVTPSTEIRAFLYSMQDIHLFGVMTKIDVQGGIHGNNVTLSAVRESDESSKTDPSYTVYISQPGTEQEFWFTPTSVQRTLDPDKSNLRIAYDYELYTDPPVGIPVTDDVTMFVQSK